MGNVNCAECFSIGLCLFIVTITVTSDTVYFQFSRMGQMHVLTKRHVISLQS